MHPTRRLPFRPAPPMATSSSDASLFARDQNRDVLVRHPLHIDFPQITGRMDHGQGAPRIVLLSAPSGAGKTTICQTVAKLGTQRGYRLAGICPCRYCATARRSRFDCTISPRVQSASWLERAARAPRRTSGAGSLTWTLWRGGRTFSIIFRPLTYSSWTKSGHSNWKWGAVSLKHLRLSVAVPTNLRWFRFGPRCWPPSLRSSLASASLPCHSQFKIEGVFPGESYGISI